MAMLLSAYFLREEIIKAEADQFKTGGLSPLDGKLNYNDTPTREN